MKILILSTYPIDNPIHGGQLRVKNIIAKYRASGHQVELCGVIGSEHYPQSKSFIPYPGSVKLSSILQNTFLMEDYCIGKLVERDQILFKALDAKIKIEPDIIQFEHPWLCGFAKRINEWKKWKAKLIYSSHNIEHRLKSSIVGNYMAKSYAEYCDALIYENEVDSIDSADGIICVSDADYDWVCSRTDKPVIMSPNGVAEWDKESCGNKPVTKFALFCASAHPPNVKGFYDMLGFGFGSLNPDQKLIVAGDCGPAILNDERMKKNPMIERVLHAVGQVSYAQLIEFLNSAHVIILPITQGEGTNLKTAEALFSGKYVLATSKAMRGFERYSSSSGVYIADNASEFKRLLRFIMQLEPLSLTKYELKYRESVLWKNTLSNLDSFLKVLKSS